MADNILVKDATGATKTMRTVDKGTAHVPVHRVEGYDEADDMIKVKSVQKKFRDEFAGVTIDTTKWVSGIEVGGSIVVSGGQLSMTSGTTINSETFLTSVDVFTVPFRVSFHLMLNQRIANQSFIVEAVSVNPTTLVPDGQNSIGWVFDGTSATSAKYRVQSGGNVPLDAANTVVSTSGAGAIFEIEPYSDEAWFHSGVMDSSAGRSNSYRRHQQIPNPNAVYKLRLRWVNHGTAPVTSGGALMQFVSCQDYAELTAEITAGRGQAAAGQALGVAVLSIPQVAVVSQNNVFFNESVTPPAASAVLTTSARDVEVASGSTHRYSLFNASVLSDVSGKLRIEVSNDNVTWRRITADTTCAANDPVILSVPIVTRYYRSVFVNDAALGTVFMLNTSFTSS